MLKQLFRFVNSIVYYGVSLNAGALAGDLFINNTLSEYINEHCHFL